MSGRHNARDVQATPPLRIRVDDPQMNWPNSGAVAEAMLREWLEHGQPLGVVVVTCGRTAGAEQMARTIAKQRNWAIENSSVNHEDVALTFTKATPVKADQPGHVVPIRNYTVNYGLMFIPEGGEWKHGLD